MAVQPTSVTKSVRRRRDARLTDDACVRVTSHAPLRSGRMLQ